jgi:flagellar biosynthesis protein FliP
MQKSATPSSPITPVEQAAPGRIASWWNTRVTLVLLWLGAALVLAGVLLIYFHPWGSVAGAGGDFQPFYRAAQAIRQGHDPYQARVSALQHRQ